MINKEDITDIFNFFDRLRISGSEADKLVALKDKLRQSVLPQEIKPLKPSSVLDPSFVKENGIKLGAIKRPTAQQLRKKGTSEEAGDKAMEETLEEVL